jgi:hypothetical protein
VNLNFVSLDDNIHVTCIGVETAAVVRAYAAIFMERDIAKADVSGKKTLSWQQWDGQFTQYAGAGDATYREKMAMGDCKIYAFARADERDAFCRWTKATGARYIRSEVQIQE